MIDAGIFHDLVSILIQPEGRMQHLSGVEVPDDFVIVSILIQPEGRMQHAAYGDFVAGDGLVSILIQPEGRMQQWLSHSSY